ncbi:MAG: methicillin resistance protein [uncultured bacterium]|nr:MAG: methicillin resistance protein [uncultured bacterium]
MSRSFLQTKDWAEFQEAYGRKIFWIDDKLVVKFDLPFGKSWFYAARIELKTENEKRKTKEIELFYKELAELANKENAIFCKIEPNLLENTKIQDTITKQIINLKSKIVNCLQPQDELILDVSLTEEKLLEQMHSKTRYNIRLAQKKDLKVEVSQDSKDIDIFYNLAVKTSAHDGFKYHSRAYYQKMLKILGNGKEVKVELVTCYMLHDHVPVASAILLYHGDMCYYLHGASDWSKRQLMAPYLMQWEAIKCAKKKGCKWYNFGGVAPLNNAEHGNKLDTEQRGIIQNLSESNKSEIINHKSKISTNHSWSGITRFKMGFINQNFNQENFLHYPDAYDIVYQPALYWMYKIVKKYK